MIILQYGRYYHKTTIRHTCYNLQQPTSMEHTVLKYFPDITENQKTQFERLGCLYPDWNAKINVISRKDIDNLYINHILHSLSIGKFLDSYGAPVKGTAFLDMGTGGGFPGIPLAILYPDCSFHLIDRIGKKIEVARNIAHSIGLLNVTFQHGDIGECKGKYDFVVSRAVMKLNELVRLVSKNISHKEINPLPNGVICLKGGDLDNEINQTNRTVMDIDLTDYFSEPRFVTKKLVYVPMSI